MFNWFKKTSMPTMETVPYIEPPEKPANVFYRIGTTDQNRVAFQMGYSEITMDKKGVDNMIRQLAVFRDQLDDDVDEQTTTE